MADKHDQGSDDAFGPKQNSRENNAAPENKPDENTHESFKEEDQFTAGNQIPEIATNDGSVVETLDTALHGTPGWSEGENLSGSSRADYYEARSYGKSDAEEELDELRNRNRNGSNNDVKE
ncbi:MAG: hypothetical protein H7122_17425 [Chitinophagaceae bacterium]|nr:hypothetical protein [Chitinophagaceae bacterium]